MVIKRIIRSLLSSVLILSAVSTAALAQIRRVPAEFEPQEAIWLQWPGHYEKTYESAYAQITNVLVDHAPTLHILYDKNNIKNEARSAIGNAGGDPDDPYIIWHQIPNENAWMRDNGPVYGV